MDGERGGYAKELLGDLEPVPEVSPIFFEEEVSQITSKIQENFLNIVRNKAVEILSNGNSSLNGHKREAESIRFHLDYSLDNQEIRSAMELYSSAIGDILLDVGRSLGYSESDNYYGVYFKVLRESLGEILFSLALNKETGGLKNIHSDGSSLRVKVKHNGKSASENFHTSKYNGSKFLTVKQALQKRTLLLKKREKIIEEEKAELERIAKQEDFKQKVIEAEKKLMEDGIIEEIEIKREILRGTEASKEGKERYFVEENIICGFKIRNLNIRVDPRGSSRYFCFSKKKNGKSRKAEKRLPQYNGKAFGEILEDIYSIYLELSGRSFSIYEKYVLSQLGQIWKYDNTR